MSDADAYLQVSPYKSDGGEIIGRVPKEVGIADLRALGHPEKVMKAIRAKCIDCAAGQESEVRKCVQVDCPLWPMRMGKNPFHGKSSWHKESAE